MRFEHYTQDSEDYDLDTASTEGMLFMARLIAQHPHRAPCVCKMFLDHLDNAIYLRMYQSVRFTSCTGDEVGYKEKFHTHWHFIQTLEEIRWWMFELIHRNRPPIVVPEPEPA
jgi:hypothetical protein